jgi:hypothetical protein
MGFTVVPQGGMKDRDYFDYLTVVGRTLLKRGAAIESVPVVCDPDIARHCLYVSENEAEARQFVKELARRTGKRRSWQVKPVTTAPTLGPLCPLLITLGLHWDDWLFGLGWLTEKILQARFPGSCPYSTVMIGTPTRDAKPTTEELRSLAGRVLLILTGLSVEQLKPFGRFLVYEPGSGEEYLSPSPIASINVGWEATRTSCSGTLAG